MSVKSAEVVVLEAFNVHFFKEIAQSQLESAAKSLLPAETRKSLAKCPKTDYIMPLAEHFIAKDILAIRKRASLASLKRTDVKKISTF